MNQASRFRAASERSRRLRDEPFPKPPSRAHGAVPHRCAAIFAASGILAGLTLWSVAGCGLAAPGRPEASINGGATRQGIGLAPSGHTPSTDLRVGAGGRTRTAHGHGTGPGTTMGRPAGHAPPGVTPGRAPSTGTGSASGYSGSLGLRRGIVGAGPAGSGTGTTIPNRMGSSATGRNAGTAFGTQGGGVGGVVTRSTPGPSGNGEAPHAVVRPAPTGLGHTGAVGTGFPVRRMPVRAAASLHIAPTATNQADPGISAGTPAEPVSGSLKDARPAGGTAARPDGARTGTVPGAKVGSLSQGAWPGHGPFDDRWVPQTGRAGHAYRVHMGVYHPPSWHRTPTSLRNPESPPRLPMWSTLIRFNGDLVHAGTLSPWVRNMGVHYGHPGPGLNVMVNRSRELVAVEAGFPAFRGWQPWYDQPRDQPAGAIYTEHLYFVAPAAITPTMSKTVRSDLTGYPRFAAVNAVKTQHYTNLGPDPDARAITEGPPGFGLRVLVANNGPVVGLVAVWSSHDPLGWRPWFDQPQGRPLLDPKLGSIYTQHLWLVDPGSLPNARPGFSTPV